MSGRLPATSVPLSPSASRDGQIGELQEQLRGKANRNTEEIFTTIILRAPGGAYFRVKVNDAGAISTEVVTR